MADGERLDENFIRFWNWNHRKFNWTKLLWKFENRSKFVAIWRNERIYLAFAWPTMLKSCMKNCLKKTTKLIPFQTAISFDESHMHADTHALTISRVLPLRNRRDGDIIFFDWVVIVVTPCRAYRQSTWLTPAISTLSSLCIHDLFVQWITAFEPTFDSIWLLLPLLPPLPLIDISSGAFSQAISNIIYENDSYKCYSLVFISS